MQQRLLVSGHSFSGANARGCVGSAQNGRQTKSMVKLGAVLPRVISVMSVVGQNELKSQGRSVTYFGAE